MVAGTAIKIPVYLTLFLKTFDDFFSHVEFVRLENALNPSISPLKIITIAHMTKFESGTDSTGFLPCSFTCFIPLPYPPGFKQ